MNISNQAKQVASRCLDAYSAEAYASWPAVAAMLLRRGYTEQQAEIIMRSKWTRWARDAASTGTYGKYKPKHLAAFIDSMAKDDHDSLFVEAAR